MSVLGPALGGKFVIEHNGKKYEASLITSDVRLAYERASFMREMEILSKMKNLYSDEEYLKEVKGLKRKYLDGGFSFLSQDGLESIKNPQGALQLFKLLFKDCDENELLGLFMSRQQEMIDLLTLIINESFSGIQLDVKGAQAAGGEAEKNAPSAA